MSEPALLDPSADDTIPSLVRVQAVAYYVSKEPTFAEKLGVETVQLRKRNGKVSVVNAKTFEIAKALVAKGKDPTKISKNEILAGARQYLGLEPAAATANLLPKKDSEAVTRAIDYALNLASSARQANGPDFTKEILALRKKLDAPQKGESILIAYALVLTASQLSTLEPSLAVLRPDFEKLIQIFKDSTVEL